jgi:hypothetical protein
MAVEADFLVAWGCIYTSTGLGYSFNIPPVFYSFEDVSPRLAGYYYIAFSSFQVQLSLSSSKM